MSDRWRVANRARPLGEDVSESAGAGVQVLVAARASEVSKQYGTGTVCSMKHIVIVGGGFAGLNAAKKLGGRRDVRVTLVDRQNYHLFQPLLYQVAMAGLSPADIATPIRSVLARCGERLGAAGIGRADRSAGEHRTGGFRATRIRLSAPLLWIDPELFRPLGLGGARAQPEDDSAGYRDSPPPAERLRRSGTGPMTPRDAANC